MIPQRETGLNEGAQLSRMLTRSGSPKENSGTIAVKSPEKKYDCNNCVGWIVRYGFEFFTDGDDYDSEKENFKEFESSFECDCDSVSWEKWE
jgi:hypothetical protein